MVDLRHWSVGAPGSKGRWHLLAHRRLSFLVPISLKLQVCDLQPRGRRNCPLGVPLHRRQTQRETLKQSLDGASYSFHQLVFILFKWCLGPTSKISKETKSSVLTLLLVIFWVIASYSSFHSTMLTSSPTLPRMCLHESRARLLRDPDCKQLCHSSVALGVSHPASVTERRALIDRTGRRWHGATKGYSPKPLYFRFRAQN